MAERTILVPAAWKTSSNAVVKLASRLSGPGSLVFAQAFHLGEDG